MIQGAKVEKVFQRTSPTKGTPVYQLYYTTTDGRGDQLTDEFDAVIVTVPAPQALPLVHGLLDAGKAPFLSEEQAHAIYSPVATAMLKGPPPNPQHARRDAVASLLEEGLCPCTFSLSHAYFCASTELIRVLVHRRL
jgi:hypothetical protein